MKDLEAPLFGLIVGLIFILLGVTVLYTINPKIESNCIERGGQVLVTPGRFSSCLYSAKN